MQLNISIKGLSIILKSTFNKSIKTQLGKIGVEELNQ